MQLTGREPSTAASNLHYGGLLPDPALVARSPLSVGQVRCWTIQQGTMAPGAAGVIHSDFERGFIKAEVVAYDDFRRWVGLLGVAVHLWVGGRVEGVRIVLPCECVADNAHDLLYVWWLRVHVHTPQAVATSPQPPAWRPARAWRRSRQRASTGRRASRTWCRTVTSSTSREVWAGGRVAFQCQYLCACMWFACK